MMNLRSAVLFLSAASAPLVASTCPYLASDHARGVKSNVANPHIQHHSHRRLRYPRREGDGGIPEGGYAAVRKDIAAALVDSQAFFPADFDPPIGPNYGGLMIRLAWHCAGSYRESDGRGGCDGGRIRFDPELNWPDNANLDKALRILEPIKAKYGSSLSWGDLIVLAGNTAIETAGGPILGFCGGRIDDPDGSNSLILGPSEQQEELAPCVSIGRQGQCSSPLGPTTVGLIYVDPVGPRGFEGDPVASGEDVRNAFGRMGFNDRETVALVGGGHAFGRCHGACMFPPCGEGELQGIGPNTFTSGFEGAWTTLPTTWTNQYFQNMFQYNWTQTTSPAGNLQWKPEDPNAPDIMMLTADLALRFDSKFEPIALEFMESLEALNPEFAAAWYRLTTEDMGPSERCLGSEVPPPQPWQNALPAGPEMDDLPNYIPVRSKIQEMIDDNENLIPKFQKLALQCADTFRETDYRGGCNGARIRFEPEILWPSNAGAADILAELELVKEAFPEISHSDIIVLAGQTAVEAAGLPAQTFCSGRVDATDGAGSEALKKRVYDPAFLTITDDWAVKGLTQEEGVALMAPIIDGTLSNVYFSDLKAGNGEFSEEELALLDGAVLEGIVDKFVTDKDAFLKHYGDGFKYLMTADRYDGPTGNACTGVDTPTLQDKDDSSMGEDPVSSGDPSPVGDTVSTNGDTTNGDIGANGDTTTNGDTASSEETSTSGAHLVIGFCLFWAVFSSLSI